MIMLTIEAVATQIVITLHGFSPQRILMTAHGIFQRGFPKLALLVSVNQSRQHSLLLRTLTHNDKQVAHLGHL